MTDPIWTWTRDIGSQSVHNQSLTSQEKTDINIGLNKTQRSFDISRQNLHICNFAVIHYQLLWPNCCKTSTFGDIKAITCDSACRGNYGTSAWPRSMHEPSTVITHVWSRDHQQSERRAFTQTKPWRLRDVGLLPIIEIFSFKKCIWKYCLQNDSPNQRIQDNPISLQTHFFNTLKSRQIARIWNALCWKKSSCWVRKQFGNEQTTSHYRIQNGLINRLNRVFMHR